MIGKRCRSEGFPARSYLVPAHGTPGVLPDGQSRWDVVAVAVIWKFRLTFRPGNYIWSLSLWIWTQMRHLGTLIPRFCTEFRYLSYGQSGFACGATFEKVPKYRETPSFSKIYMSIFSGTSSQDELFPMRPPAALSDGELEGLRPSKMQGVAGLAAPGCYLIICSDSRIISEWLVLQNFQIHMLYQNG